MSKRLDVIYENGVFRPLESVAVREHQRGTVTLSEPEEDWLDTDYMDRCAAEVQEHVSLETVRNILSKIPEPLADEICTEREAR
jgi:predicted DNA-binding antitoxin AbrB/MazE fold protein